MTFLSPSDQRLTIWMRRSRLRDAFSKRFRLLLAASTAALTMLYSTSAGAGYVFTQIDFLGGAFTYLAGVNASGTVIGNSGFGDGGSFGFVISKGLYSTVNFPAASSTVVTGISNSGDIVGWYDSPSGVNHGFILQGSVFTTVDFPGATQATRLTGISASGNVVVGDTGDRAFPFTEAFIIDDSTTTMLVYPGAQTTGALGVNNRGTVVGFFMADQYSMPQGYLFDSGVFDVLNYPGAVGSIPTGINSSGDIVGIYQLWNAANTNTISHGFLRSGGELVTLDYPGAYSTELKDINARGDIVGSYIDSANRTHGFIAYRVPEPSPLALLGLGLAGLAFTRRCRK